MKRTFIFLWLMLFALCGWTQQEFSQYIQRLSAFGKSIQQEKVFVHMDNTSYFLGDTIWFSAYTRQTNTDTPSKVSGVLYAKLYSLRGGDE